MEAKEAMGHSDRHVITTSVLSLALFPNYVNTFYRHCQDDLIWCQWCVKTKLFANQGFTGYTFAQVLNQNIKPRFASLFKTVTALEM